MRRSCMQSPGWFAFAGEGQPIEGIALGSDACAEHEWGTEGLRIAFGLDPTKDGVERRQIRRVPEGLTLIDKTGVTALFYTPTSGDYGRGALSASQRAERWLQHPELHYSSEHPLVAAWDEQSFGVVAHGKKDDIDRVRVRELWEAFQRKDVAFWTNIGVFHSGGGLIFAIVSRVREEDKKTLLDSDVDRRRLEQCSEATGIREFLRKAGKGYYALRPKWVMSSYEGKTRYGVIYWLNPCEQREDNSGCFTVEELQLWAEGKGPIPKEAT